MNDLVPRVLMVEDDPDMVALVRGIWGDDLNIIHAATMADGADQLRDNEFDVLLFDIDLPDGKGTDLLVQLRAGDLTTRNQHKPAVMMTASRKAKDYETSWDLDTLAYVCKPIAINELRTAMRLCLDRPS